MPGSGSPSAKERERKGQGSAHSTSGGPAGAGGVFSDSAALFSLIGIAIRDAARLLGLEARLVVKTVVMMVVLGVLLGAVTVGIWLSTTLIVASALYEYTGLGFTLSIAFASLVNMVSAGVIILVLKRLMLRLSFPQTRVAVRTLLHEASRTMQKQE